MESDSISVTALIGIVGALLTVFIKLFDAISSWKKSRDTSARERLEIQHTAEEVSFIQSWLEAVANSTDGAELESRRHIALKRLDHLMGAYQQHNFPEKQPSQQIAPKTRAKNNDKGFYAISIFLVLGILGLFIDDEGEFSTSYFMMNIDTDAILGFSFFLAIWVYFLVTSSFFHKRS